MSFSRDSFFRTACHHNALCVVMCVTSCLANSSHGDENWAQFRGPNASGVSQGKKALPAEVGADNNLLWKSEVGKGHSSPVIYDGRVYLTTKRGDELLTMALDATDGKLLWQKPAEYERLEKIHRVGSHATPSVVTDGRHVVSFFGSSGMYVYDTAGQLKWHKKMGPFDNSFGSAASPIIVGGLVITLQDHDTGGFLAAYKLESGDLAWHTARDEYRRNYCSPIVWRRNGRTEIIVAGTGQVNAYGADNGKRLWTVRRGSRVVSATPVVGQHGRLFVVNSGGGEAPSQPAFDELLKTADANKNGKMEKGELPKSIIRNFITQFDRDKDGSLNRKEYETIRTTMTYAKPIAMAITPESDLNKSESAIAWSRSKSLPRNSSPLVVLGRLYMVNDAGIFSVLDAATGKELHRGRVRGKGKFFSSPVYGDNKIYAVSDRGKINVLSAQPPFAQISTGDVGEPVYATPAIAGGRLYVRTISTLYCFAQQPTPN